MSKAPSSLAVSKLLEPATGTGVVWRLQYACSRQICSPHWFLVVMHYVAWRFASQPNHPKQWLGTVECRARHVDKCAVACLWFMTPGCLLPGRQCLLNVSANDSLQTLLEAEVWTDCSSCSAVKLKDMAVWTGC